MTDEEAMGRWFAKVTKPQLARYNERMHVASAYRGSPRWDRIRADAQREFKQTTADAASLYQQGMDEIIACGEVSEATDEALTAFMDKNRAERNAFDADLAVIRAVLERA